MRRRRTMAETARFTLTPKGPFSMDSARTFGCGCFLASRSCGTQAEQVSYAFPLDGSFDTVGVSLRRRGDRIEGEVVGTRDGETAGAQVARMLSLDHDATGFAQVLAANPALRSAAEAHPGFRPPVFFSPYVFAGWAVLSQRLSMRQA